MTARAAVYELLSEDATLASLGVQNTYSRNAVDAAPEQVFLVLAWGNSTREFGSSGPVMLSVWCHDRQRDYGRINSILARVEDILTDAVHVLGADGWTLTVADSIGQGPDAYDEGYDTITRYSEFTVISRYDVPN